MSHTKYFGLLIVVGRSKKEVFDFVIDQVWKKIKRVERDILVQVGTKTLIKVVAHEMPSYIISCYILPEGCYRDLECLLEIFWWGAKEDDNKIHWMS